MQKEKIDPEHTLKPIFHPNRNNFVKQPNTKSLLRQQHRGQVQTVNNWVTS